MDGQQFEIISRALGNVGMLREFHGMSARTATRIGVERRIKKRYRLSKRYEIFIRSVKESRRCPCRGSCGITRLDSRGLKIGLCFYKTIFI